MTVFWSKKTCKPSALGVFSSSSGTALAAIEGAQNGCPRVTGCVNLPPDMTVAEYVIANDLSNANCVDVLPFGTYSLMQVELQGVKDDEKREAVRWQIRELLDYPAEEAILDLLEVPIIGQGEQSRTFVVVAPATTLRARVEVMGAAGLHFTAIDIPELALRNILELYRNEPRGHCLLWLREHSSLMTISRGETFFFSRSINIGVEQLRQEKITTEDNLLAENIQALLDGIILEVQRSLDYCESNFRLPPVPKILVAICDQESEEILDYLNRYLQPEVTFADFRQVLDFPLELDPATINACLPALGAALRAGGRG